jgi:LysR family transcriptional regulator, hydrogen peroxide-inducible genes activator
MVSRAIFNWICPRPAASNRYAAPSQQQQQSQEETGMTLRELRYLVALADRAHFGKAAEACHVSQPTMSTQIRKLEEYLGATLIERNTKSIALTPMGQTVVEKARRIVSQVDELVASTRAPQEALAGPLSLGIIPTLGPYFLPWFLPRIKHSYPRLQLVVQEDLTRHLLERLKNYQIDAALLALPLDGEDLEQLPLFDEPFWFACAPQHPLARRQAVGEAELRDEPLLLLLADGHCFRGQALAACGRQGEGEDSGDDFRAVSLETICQLVASGYGCTLLPALAAQPQAAQSPLSVLPMRSANASRRIGLVWRRGYPKAEELALLAELVREEPPQGTRTVLVEEKALRAGRH